MQLKKRLAHFYKLLQSLGGLNTSDCSYIYTVHVHTAGNPVNEMYNLFK